MTRVTKTPNDGWRLRVQVLLIYVDDIPLEKVAPYDVYNLAICYDLISEQKERTGHSLAASCAISERCSSSM